MASSHSRRDKYQEEHGRQQDLAEQGPAALINAQGAGGSGEGGGEDGINPVSLSGTPVQSRLSDGRLVHSHVYRQNSMVHVGQSDREGKNTHFTGSSTESK